MTITIPIMHCFDNNYVIPAGVAFYSMLEHANPQYNYKLYVLHNDITNENQQKLQQSISQFKNANLEFIKMNGQFEELFNSMDIQAHYSKEVIYKLLCASIFPQYEKIIVADVDVVYLGDISPSYFMLDSNEDFYLAGVKIVGKIFKSFLQSYGEDFSEEDYKKIIFCGGYFVMNLKKLREDNLEKILINCFKENTHRLRQAEMDVLNLVCHGKVKYLPLNYLTCSYMYDIYCNEDDFKNDVVYSETELKEAMQNPIQLHFASNTKPWNDFSCTKAEEWFKILSKTIFLKDFLLQQKKQNKKVLCYFSFPLSKSKKVHLEIWREKR